jgi:hypothetical protein
LVVGIGSLLGGLVISTWDLRDGSVLGSRCAGSVRRAFFIMCNPQILAFLRLNERNDLR